MHAARHAARQHVAREHAARQHVARGTFYFTYPKLLKRSMVS